jgi:GNAT superfamily N-acetyltransferase
MNNISCLIENMLKQNNISFNNITKDDINNVIKFVINEPEFKIMPQQDLKNYIMDHVDFKKSIKATVHGEIIGTILVGTPDFLNDDEIYKDKNNFEIVVLVVKQDYRKQNVGLNLVKKIESKFLSSYDNIVVQVYKSLKTHKFWKNLGYEFYKTIEDEIEPVYIYIKSNK